MRIFPKLENWSLFWGLGECSQLRTRENITFVKPEPKNTRLEL